MFSHCREISSISKIKKLINVKKGIENFVKIAKKIQPKPEPK